jgi:hypothetical protein
MAPRPELLAAFDRAIAATDGAARRVSPTRTGEPSGPRLATLRDELVRARAAAAERGTVDPAWVRKTVRSTAEWLPDDALPLLAALGAIARAASLER